MKTFEIDDYKGVYYIYVEAKDATPTKPVDVKYNVKLVRKANNLIRLLPGSEVPVRL